MDQTNEDEIWIETREETVFSSAEPVDVDSGITFCTSDNEEAIKIEANGKFTVNGKIIKEDIELYDAFVKFFSDLGIYEVR